MPTTLPNLNRLDQAEFVRTVGPLFEHSPWIAERTWGARPFSSAEGLHTALLNTVAAASEAEKIGLIRAHPDLAGKLAVSGQLTEHSTTEQKSARLDQLTPEQFAHITALNDRYRQKFGFPFVICVKDHTQNGIFSQFEKRTNHEIPAEILSALHEIGRIAWHRLQLLLGPA